MTGLDLESFLQLLRADLGAWASLGLVASVLALMTWTSWGSRRALRKCLVLSIGAHLGLVLYGSTFPIVRSVLHDESADPDHAPVRVQLAGDTEGSPVEPGEVKGPDGRPVKAVAAWDHADDAARLADPSFRPRVETASTHPTTAPTPAGRIAPDSVVVEVNPPAPTGPAAVVATAPAPTPAPPTVAPADASDVAATVAAGRPVEPPPADAIGSTGRVRPERPAGPKQTPVALARRDDPAPGLTAPPLELPTATATASPAAPAPAASALTPASVAAADPAEVAVPGPAPRRVEAASGPALPTEANLRSRTRPVDTARPAEAPGRATAPLAVASATVEPPYPAGRPETSTSPASPLAPPSVASAEPAPAPASALAIPVAARQPAAPAPREGLPEADLRLRSRPGREPVALALNDRRPELGLPATLPRVSPAGVPSLPAIAGATGLSRPPADVPAVYRSRLDPNRFALAQRAGASRESEQAVERALDWLRRHQDADGRWDGGTAKYKDGTVAEGDDDYTAHCPAGDVCFGECYYWEADTALTGLALLAYLGAGYTHLDGQYADTVARGLEYLRLAQKADGDLRGRSQAVGLYCHTMATLALCEAYALTSDPKLRAPVEKAVDFLVKARARDGLAWRYAPGAPVGDTSILGWVVMVLKSAQEVGIPIRANTKAGVVGWLNKVASGPSSGLARYQPWEKVTPTMTAEAWVCRQFLGVGGPKATADEAADYLLRNSPERTQYNLYYWYYGTLAMYQHGGDAWARWNAQARDQILRRQRLKGHAAGSWDPDESQYGTHGGRIYCTALATLSLEVYYRYLRLYEAPPTSPLPSARHPDSTLRRTTADTLPMP